MQTDTIKLKIMMMLIHLIIIIKFCGNAYDDNNAHVDYED